MATLPRIISDKKKKKLNNTYRIIKQLKQIVQVFNKYLFQDINSL